MTGMPAANNPTSNVNEHVMAGSEKSNPDPNHMSGDPTYRLRLMTKTPVGPVRVNTNSPSPVAVCQQWTTSGNGLISALERFGIGA